MSRRPTRASCSAASAAATCARVASRWAVALSISGLVMLWVAKSRVARSKSSLAFSVVARAGNGFRVGIPFIWCSNDLMVSFATQAYLYRQMTGDARFREYEQAAIDWLLGANPWGVSLMVGVGTTYPHCMQHVVANLSGSVDGRPPILRGAVVNGPNSADLFSDGLGDFFDEGVTCPSNGVDRFARFNGHGSVFVDDVRSWQTVEPAIDFTAAAILAFATLR